MTRRALILAGTDDDGVFEQAAADAAQAAGHAEAQIHAAAAPPYRARVSLAWTLNGVLAEIDADAVVVASPRVRLDGPSLAALFAAVEEDEVIAGPLVIDPDGRVVTGGQVHLQSRAREWVAELLERETADDLALPAAVPVPFTAAPCFAFDRIAGLGVGGFSEDDRGNPDLFDFAERMRARGVRATLLAQVRAHVHTPARAAPLVELRDPAGFGHPASRTTPNAELVERAGLIAALSEPKPPARREGPAPLVFGRLGALGPEAEELRALVAGLDAAELEPTADILSGPADVRTRAPAAGALERSARRNEPQRGEIWVSERDAWMAVAGEPGLIRVSDAGRLGPGLRRALDDPRALAVVPSHAVADQLVTAGVAREQVTVLAPYLGALGLDPPSDAALAVHAFLGVSDQKAFEAALRAIATADGVKRISLTWPLPHQRATVARLVPDARTDHCCMWIAAGPDPSAGVVLALDDWDRYGRRLRAALARGQAVVAHERYAALLDEAEAARCTFVDPADERQLAEAIAAARPADPVVPERSWEEQARELTEHARERATTRCGGVLIATPWLPAEDESSGHLRLLEVATGFEEVGARVTLLASDERWWSARAGDCLGRGMLALPAYDIGVEVRARVLRRGYDVIYAYFHDLATWIGPAAGAESPGVPIVVDSNDLQVVRHLREAELRSNRRGVEKALERAGAELLAYGTADLVTVVTTDEQEHLAEILGSDRIVVTTNVHRARDDAPGPQGRRGLLFVGGYDHPPNRDAVLWLMKEIAPLLAERCPDHPLVVAGSKMPRGLARLVHARGGQVLGFVPRLPPVYDRIRCTVAPLRYGAGIKGKVSESLASGVPVVTTAIGAEGFPASEAIAVADDPAGFADHVARFAEDDELWRRASAAGIELIREHHGPERCAAAMRQVLELAGAAHLDGSRT